MPSYGEGTEAYDPDETLVVDLPYMGRVRAMVAAIGGSSGVIDGGDPSHVLNLTRFKLPGLTGMSAALRQGVDDPSDLNRLLFLLRLRFADRNGGWVCEMGKYRASSFGALGLLPGRHDDPSTGTTSYTEPFPGPNPVKQAEDSLRAEEKWRSTED